MICEIFSFLCFQNKEVCTPRVFQHTIANFGPIHNHYQLKTVFVLDLYAIYVTRRMTPPAFSLLLCGMTLLINAELSVTFFAKLFLNSQNFLWNILKSNLRSQKIYVRKYLNLNRQYNNNFCFEDTIVISGGWIHPTVTLEGDKLNSKGLKEH